MNRSELVAAVAEKAGLAKKDADTALTGILESMTEALKKGDKIQLVGFGTFEIRERAARTGLNPQTKEKVQIPASKAPAFKPGKALKDSVN